MKNKKSKAAKKKSKPAGAGQPFQKAGKGIARFATSKKALGVLALATLGLSYLAKRRRQNKGTSPSTPDAEGTE
ncbi:MAG: hypothetical protein ACRYFX_24890 [Janthinobacterium lividum]